MILDIRTANESQLLSAMQVRLMMLNTCSLNIAREIGRVSAAFNDITCGLLSSEISRAEEKMAEIRVIADELKSRQ